MTDKIELDLKPDIPICTDSYDVQFLPVEISRTFDGSENKEITRHFKNKIKKDEDGRLNNALRGRPLLGSVQKLPPGYVAIVLEESEATTGLSESEGKTLRAVKKFDEFIYWNYDKPPSNEDQFKQAMEFIKIAEALHGNSSDDEEEEDQKKRTIE